MASFFFPGIFFHMLINDMELLFLVLRLTYVLSI